MDVAIADDSALFRNGLAMLLDAAGINVVIQASRGDELLALMRHPQAPRVDAAILDIRMPPSFSDEGIVTAREIRRTTPEVGVLVLSTHAETTYAVRLLEGDASGVGYLLKDHVDEVSTLRDAICRVVSGESVVDTLLVDRLLRRMEDSGPLAGLTDREREVLGCMAEGLSNSGIADRMQISAKTVEGHVNGIFEQLGLNADTRENRRVLAVLKWLRTLDDA